MIHVIALLCAKPGQRDALVDAFREILEETRHKRGCIEYGLAVHYPSGLPGQAPYDDDEVVIVEKWEDLDALKAHIADPKYRDWYTGVWPMVAGASMQILDAVG